MSSWPARASESEKQVPLGQGSCCPLSWRALFPDADARSFPLAGLDCSKPQILVPHLSGKPLLPPPQGNRAGVRIQNQHPVALRAQGRRESELPQAALNFSLPAKASETSPSTWIVPEAPWVCLWSHYLGPRCESCNYAGKHTHLCSITLIIQAPQTWGLWTR